ncbi:MAG TPA: hypothetical protein VFU21_29860, partial [Kofleriaceae bacterium]|nr:hypothetical protein [Kofleriaceae bacterium]
MKTLCLGFLISVAAPAAARAQGEVAGTEAASEPEPFVRGTISASGFYYTESASVAPEDNEQASPEPLAYTDERVRLETGNLAGGWGGLGDFRLRLTRGELAARGFEGGGEAHLREAFVVRRGERVDVALGRQILRDVDAIRIDGATVRVKPPGSRWELGGFGGLYPSPFSRSLATDYPDDRTGADLPVAGGGFAAYNTVRNHGGLGLGVVAPRDPDLVDPEPIRAFVSSNGYHLLSDRLDLFHTLVADAAGRGAGELPSAMLGASWRATDRLRIEAGASHMSTFAVEIYVRDLLEKPDPEPDAGAPVQNNLTLVRIGNDEGRLGANLSLPRRVDVWSQARVRRREALLDAEVPMEIAALPADTQIDLSGGVRQKDSLLGLDLTASGVAIRGRRTASSFATLRIRRDFFGGQLGPELEATYVLYRDRCDEGDPTCTGDLAGR